MSHFLCFLSALLNLQQKGSNSIKVCVSWRIPSYNTCGGEGYLQELARRHMPWTAASCLQSKCAGTLKSQGRSLLSRQWGNEEIQWLPFLLNTSWSKQPSSGKHFEAVSLYLLLQVRNHEEARKNCSSLALSAFSSRNCLKKSGL